MTIRIPGVLDYFIEILGFYSLFLGQLSAAG